MKYKNTGFWSAFALNGANLGVLAALLMVTVIRLHMSEYDLKSYGWRIPFLLSAAFGLLGVYIRREVSEVEEFTQIPEDEKSKSQIKDVFKIYTPQILMLTFSLATWGPCWYVVFTWMPFYITSLARDDDDDLSWNPWVLNVCMLVFIILFSQAWATFVDYAGGGSTNAILHYYNFIAAEVLLLIFAYPAFLCLKSSSLAVCTLGYLMIVIPQGIQSGSISYFMVVQFPLKYRVTALGAAYNLAHALFTSSCAVLATILVQNVSAVAPAYYIISLCVVSITALTFGVWYIERKTNGGYARYYNSYIEEPRDSVVIGTAMSPIRSSSEL